MSRLDIDISEVIHNMRKIKQEYNKIELEYRKLNLRYEELGHTWQDGEYRRIKDYIELAGTVLNRYQKESDAYLDYVLARIQALSSEYTEGIDLNEPLDLGELTEDSQEPVLEELPELVKKPRLI